AEAPDERALAGVARAHLGGGNVALERGQVPTALKDYQQALALRERLADQYPTNPTNRRDVATTWGNIATLHTRVRDWARAIAAREKSLAAYQRLVADHPYRDRLRHDYAQAQFNLGVDKNQSGQPEEAVAWIQ